MTLEEIHWSLEKRSSARSSRNPSEELYNTTCISMQTARQDLNNAEGSGLW